MKEERSLGDIARIPTMQELIRQISLKAGQQLGQHMLQFPRGVLMSLGMVFVGTSNPTKFKALSEHIYKEELKHFAEMKDVMRSLETIMVENTRKQLIECYGDHQGILDWKNNVCGWLEDRKRDLDRAEGAAAAGAAR